MAPYAYTPKLRFSGPAGPVQNFDLSNRQYVTVCQPVWEPVYIEKEFADYSYRSDALGWRVSVRLELDILPGSAEDLVMFSMNELLMDGDQTAEITLDNVVWRECSLREWIRAPLDGKNIGSKYSLLFVCRNLIRNSSFGVVERKGPPLMSGW